VLGFDELSFDALGFDTLSLETLGFDTLNALGCDAPSRDAQLRYARL
jgi:hypothetical protein